MMARPTLSPPDMNPEGITAGEWVTDIRRKRVGWVKEINGDPPCALVRWLNGKSDPVPCIYLRLVPDGEGKDRRRPV